MKRHDPSRDSSPASVKVLLCIPTVPLGTGLIGAPPDAPDGLGPRTKMLILAFCHPSEAVTPRLSCCELRHCLALLLLQMRQFLLKSARLASSEKLLEPRSRSRPLPRGFHFYEA
jgi:hypothetical protein